MSITEDRRERGELAAQMVEESRQARERINPNRATIAGLVAFAGFLTAHPELPEIKYVAGKLGSAYFDGLDRAQMELVAMAMDAHGPVVESTDSVEAKLTLQFGGEVELSASAPVEALVNNPLPPYEPILVPCCDCNGEGHISTDPCGTCDGRGYFAPGPAR